ncbi:MAG: PD40 domain-containing protein [Spirochaetales bacterium]|nr:PD40 domain-containing protein [Spirochaetales bacterium]
MNRSIVFAIILFFLQCASSFKQAPLPADWKVSPSTPAAWKDQAEEALKAYAWRQGFSERAIENLTELEEKGSAAEIEKKLKDKDLPPYIRFRLLQAATDRLIRSSELDRAIALWEGARAQLPDATVADVLKILNEKESGAVIINPGTPLNSSVPEYNPVPELSGDRIYFCAEGRAAGRGGEDIWVYNLKSREAEPLIDLNTADHEAPIGIGPDGRTLFVYSSLGAGPGNGDIYVSTREGYRWKGLRPLPEPINTRHFESDAFLSADGRALFFTSDRPGIFPYRAKNQFSQGEWWGNTDIYVSEVFADGSYGEPVPLGPVINTPAAERTPFLHPDGRTLYFSSSGHSGLGNLDIFKSVRQDDSWQNWSVPVNIGRVVNSLAPDWGFMLTAAADRAYFSGSPQRSASNADIYEVRPLPALARPAGVILSLRGRTEDTSGNPLGATILLTSSGRQSQQESDPASGEFYLTVPAERIQISAQRDGYQKENVLFDFSKEKYHATHEVRLVLKKIESRQVEKRSAEKEKPPEILERIAEEERRARARFQQFPAPPPPALKDPGPFKAFQVQFETGSAEITLGSSQALFALRDQLLHHPDLKLVIEGHADERGSDAYNLQLSERRAREVQAFLRWQGIAADRLLIVASGKRKPLRQGKTAADYAVNRRVEVRAHDP